MSATPDGGAAKPVMYERQTEVLTPEQVAAELQVTKRTAITLCTSGKLQAFHVGRYWRIPRVSLERYIAMAVSNGRQAA